MSYVNQNLISNERVLRRAKITNWSYLIPACMVPVFGIGLILLILAFIRQITTELALTDKRVIAKVGLISRRTIEQRLTKVESLRVEQSILGRILNYGTVVVQGTGGAATPIKNVADPLAFKSTLENQVNVVENPEPVAPQPSVMTREQEIALFMRLLKKYGADLVAGRLVPS